MAALAKKEPVRLKLVASVASASLDDEGGSGSRHISTVDSQSKQSLTLHPRGYSLFMDPAEPSFEE